MTAYNTSMQVSSVSPTGVNGIDALLGGTKWGGGAGSGTTVTFSFPWTTNSSALWYRDASGDYSNLNEPFATYHYGLDATQVQAARAALQAWANVANVGFQEISETGTTVGDIRFTWTSAASGNEWGHAWYPWSGWAPGGDIWLYSGMAYPSTNWSAGSHNYKSLLHEIGHAIGLKHPFEGAVTLPSTQDEMGLTVMSYTNSVGYSDDPLGFYPTTPMWYDIQVAQFLYGPNMSYHGGNDAYVYRADQRYYETIWDAGGRDTILYISTHSGCEIDLRPGHWSELGIERELYTASGTLVSPDTVNIYATVTIENATGGDGPDTLLGNGVANVLTGGKGADVLRGATGKDTLSGGSGGDNLKGGGGSDLLGGGDGSDTLSGGTGADRFNFNTPLGGAHGVDRIIGFNAAADLVRLDDDIFTTAGAANLALDPRAFYQGAVVTDAHDSTDRILYNTTSGNLYYDPDGTGTQAATLFATLGGAPTITAADFFIVA